MKKVLLVLLLTIQIVAQAQTKLSQIRMERSPCFGKCPSYVITIQSNGALQYEGRNNAPFTGKRTAKLTPAQTKKLFKQFEQQKLKSLKSVYPVIASDLPHLHYTFHWGKKSKTVKNAELGPAYLKRFADDIDALVKGLHWSRGSKQTFSDEGDEVTPQESGSSSVDEKKIYSVVDQMPQFPGGDAALSKFIKDNLVYPALAKEAGVQGKVICSFIVTPEGKVTELKVLRGIGSGCDEEAIRVLSKSPHWLPGEHMGKPVNVRFTIPINFILVE